MTDFNAVGDDPVASDTRVGFGERPALLVIDFIRAFTQPCSPFFCQGVVNAVAASVPLIDAARRARIPIFYTRVRYHPSGVDGGLLIKKTPGLAMLVDGEPLAEIDPRVAPEPEDLVIAKNYPSCFYGTSLSATLNGLGIDTTILIGSTTSGCVRAAAMDAIQYGFRVIVPRECVGDRCPVAHETNLAVIDERYGDVMGRQEVIARFDALGYGGARRAAE